MFYYMYKTKFLSVKNIVLPDYKQFRPKHIVRLSYMYTYTVISCGCILIIILLSQQYK